MTNLSFFLQNASTLAFLLLGLAVGISWLRRRQASLAFLALAIVCLSLVTVLSRISLPFIPQLSLLLFVASSYSLLRFRASLIPLSSLWHRAVLLALGIPFGLYLLLQVLSALHLAPLAWQLPAAILLILVWSATILEPVVRFWRLSRHLPTVQAWRLRSLSFGFGGLIFILLFAIVSLAFTSTPLIQVLIQFLVLFIIPLLYISFSPPAWLRRQWRSSEEEGLRSFMQDLLLLHEDPAILADKALQWAARLVGGDSAVLFDLANQPLFSHNLSVERLQFLTLALPSLPAGASRFAFPDSTHTLFIVPVGAASVGRLVILAGAFTPDFGGDELNRVQQFMTAVAAALDRVRLISSLSASKTSLELAQSHLQSIIDIAFSAIVTADAQDLITGWNPQAEAMFGFKREEVLGRSLTDTIIPQQHRQAHLDGLKHYLATGQTKVFGQLLEHSALDKSGREFPIELSVSSTSNNGAPFFVAFMRDITERKKAESALLRINAELLDANLHKSIFLANMSHELRTPLNAILGFSQLLIDSTSENVTPEQRLQFLNHIHSGGIHLLSLINDILDLSKIEAGQMELHFAATSLDDILSSALSTIQPLADIKGIHLASLPPTHITLIADAGKLRQMLLNLLSNGIKFTPSGGSVSLAVRLEDSMLEISVTDTGIGLTHDELGLLFQEFRQIDQGANRDQEGTGLGLALTRRLVTLHGGSVNVTSTKGVGSTFTLVLPLTPPGQSPASPPLPPLLSDPSLPLILIVEDNPAASDLLAHHLLSGGFRVAFATTGPMALSQALALSPSAITLDIMLPEMDGWEVLKHLKADPLTASIPVIVVSVLDNQELAKALGALDFLVKPVERTSLLSALSRTAPSLPRPPQEVRILVIDDELANRTLLTSILTPSGFTVFAASSGKQGLSVLPTFYPHLILLDLRMPDMDGFAVVTALRSAPATASIPIVVMTARDITAQDISRLSGHVSAVFERKSVTDDELISRLHELITPSPPA